MNTGGGGGSGGFEEQMKRVAAAPWWRFSRLQASAVKPVEGNRGTGEPEAHLAAGLEDGHVPARQVLRDLQPAATEPTHGPARSA